MYICFILQYIDSETFSLKIKYESIRIHVLQVLPSKGNKKIAIQQYSYLGNIKEQEDLFRYEKHNIKETSTKTFKCESMLAINAYTKL